MVFCFDIDGVLAQFTLPYAQLLMRISGKDPFPEYWYRNPDSITPVWEWEKHWGFTDAHIDAAWRHITKEGSTFWADLPTMPLGKDVIKRLNGMAKYEGHDIYFITDRPGHSAKFLTEQWLYTFGMAYPTVLIVKAAQKFQAMEALQTDVFIDDKLPTVKSAIGRVKRVYLKSAPYNEERVDGSEKFYTRVNTAQEMLELEGLWKPDEVKKAMFWRK